MNFGPTELILILVIIVIFFGVGRLPEVFGAVGKGLREFRKAAADDELAKGLDYLPRSIGTRVAVQQNHPG